MTRFEEQALANFGVSLDGLKAEVAKLYKEYLGRIDKSRFFVGDRGYLRLFDSDYPNDPHQAWWIEIERPSLMKRATHLSIYRRDLEAAGVLIDDEGCPMLDGFEIDGIVFGEDV